MKANAPEKIYVADTTFPDYVDFDGSPINTKRIDEHDIEYIHSDVFIEKVAKWLNNFYNEGTHSYLIDEDIEKFIDYMKGE